MATTGTDGKLALQLRDGNKEAFEKIFMIYSGKILRFTRSILKSDSDAQDLTQSLFVKLWENRDSFNPAYSIDSYMYAIARNAAINFIKSRKLHQNLESNTSDDYLDYTTDNLINMEEIDEIMDATLESMPKQCKVIYTMSQKDGLSPKTIAENLNLSEKTIRNQLSLIFKELRKSVDIYLSR